MIRCNAVAPIDGEIRCEGPVDHEGHHRADVFAAAVGPSGPEVYHRVSWPRDDEPTRVHTADLQGIGDALGSIAGGSLGGTNSFGPLVVTPQERAEWLRQRAEILASAVAGRLDPTRTLDTSVVLSWVDELSSILCELHERHAHGER